VRNAGFSATAYASGFPAGSSVRATAWDGNALYAADYSDGGLYRADAGPGGPGPSLALTATSLGTVTGGLRGLALSGGHLYATLVDSGEVVELDKTNAARIRTIASGIAPRGIATDPLTGDLIVTGAAFIYRIASLASTPVTSFYTQLPGNVGTRAIAIGPSGTIFVVNDYGQLWTIESTAAAATHTGTANAAGIGAPVSGIVGVSVITNGVDTLPQFLLLTTSAGAVYKTPIGGTTSDTTLVLDGAGAGGEVSVGPDRCAYASMGASVLRVADGGGTCQLSTAGVTPPAVAIANTSGQDPHVGGPAVTINAHLTNASTLGGHVVTFHVSGTNTFTRDVTSDSSGNANLSYSSLVVGVDTIYATTSADGFPATSNTITVNWLRALDTVAPTIAFSYTVPSGGTGLSFACDTTTTSASFPVGIQPNVVCGWFTKPPTITFHVTTTGASGIGTTIACDPYTLVGQPGPLGHVQSCTAFNGDGLASATLSVTINAVLSPPVVTASAMANGAPYTVGSVTRFPVAVHFDCSTSPITTGLSCPADQSFSLSGSHTATGTATDIAGQTTTATFGPIEIDATPPTITVDPGSYTFGSWTNADVHLVFSCADDRGVASCPAPQVVSATTTGVTVTATDLAGNTAQLTTGPIDIDKTAPTIDAAATTADGDPYLAGTPTNQNVTVHFVCGTDAAPVVSCGPDVTYTAAGSSTATGSATDAAGNGASTSFGPVVIDRTPPTIVAAVTVGGLPYDGSWTQGPVLVHFTCADDRQLASCPPDQDLVADRNGSVSGTARDVAGNTATATTAPIRIDRTPPVTTATLTGTSAGPATFLFAVSVGLASTDLGSGVFAISYSLDGATPRSVAGASATLVVDTPGVHHVVFHAVDAAGNVESDKTSTFSVIFRRHTSLAITSAPFLPTGTPVTARLVNTDAGVPVAGETVSFAANGVTRSAVTDATGVATVDLRLASGAYALTATYAGTPGYFPSADRQELVVYAQTRFVVWAPNATLGAVVQFYGADWAMRIGDRAARKTLNDFKGYATTVLDASWTGRTGDSAKAPSGVPQYIGVILTSSATKTKDVITGNVVGIAILRVSPPGRDHDRDRGDDRGRDDGARKTKAFDGRLGDAGFGTVVGLRDR